MNKTALLSVYDKDGLVEFAQGLVAMGWRLVSTGGTARRISEAGISVTDVGQVTGFPEIMDGRVKTLHPAVFGGILARRADPGHMKQLAEHGLQEIGLVAVNLYPFRATVERPGVTLNQALENIDIGGPSMIRAAAKNHRDVLVVTDPRDYNRVLGALRDGSDDEEFRYRLACAAFAHTAAYDAAISGWLGGRIGLGPQSMPERLVLCLDKAADLAYGENPHQAAALYREPFGAGGLLANAEQLQGKALSFNNYNDAHGAVEAVREFSMPAAVAVKHATPCGVGIGETAAEACRKAYDADPVSIYGGILALNVPLDGEAAEVLRRIHLDVLVAPGYEPAALSVLAKKTSLRVLKLGGPATGNSYDVRRIGGGLLLQTPDAPASASGGTPGEGQDPDDPATWKVVSSRRPTETELSELAFAWKVVKHVRSNAIVLARRGMTVGIGGGQTNRVDAARIAVRQAGEHARGSVLASDAYIPFPDTVEVAAEAGIVAVVQPGGSIRDAEAIVAADAAGLAMVFTGTRHLRH